MSKRELGLVGGQTPVRHVGMGTEIHGRGTKNGYRCGCKIIECSNSTVTYL